MRIFLIWFYDLLIELFGVVLGGSRLRFRSRRLLPCRVRPWLVKRRERGSLSVKIAEKEDEDEGFERVRKRVMLEIK